MAPPKPRPSEIAAEGKRMYIPYIEQRLNTYPARSYLHPDSSALRLPPRTGQYRRLRVAVVDGDPVDVALDWYEANKRAAHHNTYAGSPPPECPMIPVVNMANEKRAGGDWESGLMAPEECFCRRSNLVQALVTPWNPSSTKHYPIPQTGGLYSPSVIVYRSGPDFYQIWKDFRPIPVISVAPVRRPKVDDSGARYSFSEEKDLMQEKMRTILRIAAKWGHTELCLGAYGVVFRNPVAEVAKMWKSLLFCEPEFQGVFKNVCFAIEKNGASSNSPTDYEVFKKEFDPSNIFKTAYIAADTLGK